MVCPQDSWHEQVSGSCHNICDGRVPNRDLPGVTPGVGVKMDEVNPLTAAPGG